MNPAAQILSTPVLVVGGSLVGLSTSVFLAWHNVPHILIERHPSTSVHPRTSGVHVQAMELFRAVGLDKAIEAAAVQLRHNLGVLSVETLAGAEKSRHFPAFLNGEGLDSITPSRWGVCFQENLEPILREHAQRLGVGLRFGQELTTFEVLTDGIRAHLRNRVGGAQEIIDCKYLIAADGARSGIRAVLGIPMRGTRALSHNLSILFSADLSAACRGRDFVVCYVTNEFVRAQLTKIDGSGRWMMHVPFFPDEGEQLEDFTPSRCAWLVRAAIGVPDQAVNILSVLEYEIAARLADSFASGRIFLVGDAAHVMPPSSAFGSGTGINDGYNLAWKLAAVLRGEAGPGLLDSYGAERRPAAAFIVDQALRRYVFGEGAEPASDRASGILDDNSVLFGNRYCASAAVMPTEEDSPRTAIDNYRPVAVPGGRAPHLPIRNELAKSSVLDLFGRKWVILAAPGGAEWRAATKLVDVHVADVDFMVDPSLWAERYPLGNSGAVLIRPDGVVAWRWSAVPQNPVDELTGVLDRLLCRRRIQTDEQTFLEESA